MKKIIALLMIFTSLSATCAEINDLMISASDDAGLSSDRRNTSGELMFTLVGVGIQATTSIGLGAAFVIAVRREVIFNDGAEFILEYEIDAESAVPSPLLREQLYLIADEAALDLGTIDREYELTRALFEAAYEL
jgi:hypothetical protein